MELFIDSKPFAEAQTDLSRFKRALVDAGFDFPLAAKESTRLVKIRGAEGSESELLNIIALSAPWHACLSKRPAPRIVRSRLFVVRVENATFLHTRKISGGDLRVAIGETLVKLTKRVLVTYDFLSPQGNIENFINTTLFCYDEQNIRAGGA